jgi:hypothetical protein
MILITYVIQRGRRQRCAYLSKVETEKRKKFFSINKRTWQGTRGGLKDRKGLGENRSFMPGVILKLPWTPRLSFLQTDCRVYWIQMTVYIGEKGVKSRLQNQTVSATSASDFTSFPFFTSKGGSIFPRPFHSCCI